jgi:hypothetical protein
MMVKLPIHRKKLFVNRGIQGAMSLRFAFYWVIYHLCVWHGAFMYFFLRARLTQLTGGEPMLPLNELYGHFLTEYLPLTLAATLLLPIVIYELIRQTHRIAGPLVRFSNAMKDMMAGKTIQPIKLRDGDMLTDFEKLFNEFIVFHQSKVNGTAASEAPAPTPEDESQLVASNAAM